MSSRDSICPTEGLNLSIIEAASAPGRIHRTSNVGISAETSPPKSSELSSTLDILREDPRVFCALI
jgi:hypothetical protein